MYEIDNELRHMDNKSLKKFTSQHYPEKKNLDNVSKIKRFEEKRLFQILNLCKWLLIEDMKLDTNGPFDKVIVAPLLIEHADGVPCTVFAYTDS